MRQLKFVKNIMIITPVILTSLAIYKVQTVTDYKLGLLGWEIPKVNFLQNFSILMIGLMLILGICLYLIEFWSRKINELNSARFSNKRQYYFAIIIIFCTVTFLISVGSITNNLTRNIDLPNYHEAYTQILDKSFSSKDLADGKLVVDQAIYGNFYRDQGLITFLILIIFIFALSFFINKKNISILFFAFMISALNQALLGINKYKDLKAGSLNGEIGKDLIYGTYGQPNWYSGHLLVGLVCSLFFIEIIWKNRVIITEKCVRFFEIINYKLGLINFKDATNLKKIIMFVIYIVLILITIISTLIFSALYLSESQWGIVVGIILIILFIIKFFIKPNYFRNVLLALLLLLTIGSYPLLLFLGQKQPNQLHRAHIAEGVVDYYILNKTDKNIFLYVKDLAFGSGFDTLGENLTSLDGELKDTYNDRAHNIILDTLAFTGLIGVIIFAGFIFISFFKLNSKSSIDSYILFGIFIIVFRTIIHEYSITNTFDLLIFISVATAFLRTRLIESAGK